MTMSWLRYRYRPVLAVLLVPSLVLIGVFSYYPAARSLIGGFYQWNGFSPPTVQNFIPILLLTNGGPGTATLVPGLDMYQSAFQNDEYGYGMAIGTLVFVVMLVFTVVAMRVLRSRTA